MTDNLTLNAYTVFEPIENEAAFYLTAPKRNEGLKSLKIRAKEERNLFDVFSELALIGLDFLDVEKDLSETEREFLWQNGILVEKENEQQKPLFSCRLDAVEPDESEINRASLVVNPTLRFEPFNIANFASWTQEKHLSPYQPSVWITMPVTEIEIGYWLSPQEAKIVSEFAAGAKPVLPDDETLLKKLIAAEILIAPESRKEKIEALKETLDAAKENFAQNKYLVLRDIFPAAQTAAIRHFYRAYVEQGFMPFGDPQVEKRFRQYNEPLAAILHKNFTRLMCLVVGKEVKPAYVYAASYRDGAVLTPHTDREQCEYSISFQVDYQPEPPNHLSPWALYVAPLEHSGELPHHGIQLDSEEYFNQKKSEDDTAVYLASGDGLIYRGRELVHYRHALPDGHKSTSLFFHYVAADFAGSIH